MDQSPTRGLVARDVVEHARADSSPLHKYFEWDDDRAAELWRERQARELISSFTITVENYETPVQAFVSLDSDRYNHTGYRWTVDVMAEPTLRDSYLRTALHELQSIEARYAHVTQLSTVFRAVHKVERSLKQEMTPAGRKSVKAGK
jgi:hypothetical protein